MKRLALAIVLVSVTSCVSLAHTQLMLHGYEGRTIDEFMKERAIVPDAKTDLPAGGSVYEFHTTRRCRIYFTTDRSGKILASRSEACD